MRHITDHADTLDRYAGAYATESEPAPAPPVCVRCAGAGWLRNEVPTDHPDFGKPRRCDCAHGSPERVKSAQLELLRDHTFAAWNRKVPGAGPAYASAWDYAQAPSGWLLLQGPCGSGKTHLSAAVGNHLLDAGYDVILITASDLLDGLRTSYQRDAGDSYESLMAKYRSVQVLILDDYGTQGETTPWAREKLFQIINYRYMTRALTVITMNSSLAELAETEPRIASRFGDVLLVRHVELATAGDYRRHSPMQRGAA